MKTLCDTHLPPPSTSDERAVIPPPNAEFLKQLMLIYHDESIFSTNGAIREEPIISAKDKKELASWYQTSSNSMTDTYNYVSEVEAAHAGTSVPKTAHVLLGYGADKGGY